MSSESELEQLVRARTPELEAANAALQQRDQRLALELDASQLLQQIATQLITAQRAEALFENILDAIVAIMHSDFASLQMFYPERGAGGELRLLGHRGFSPEAARHWEWANSGTPSACGEALRTRRRVLVPEVRQCDFTIGSEDFEQYLNGGIYAAQSTPLVSRSGALLGVVSTHWRQAHEFSATELRTLDILARLAADLIEHSRVEEELREHNERLRALFNHQLVAMNIIPRRTGIG